MRVHQLPVSLLYPKILFAFGDDPIIVWPDAIFLQLPLEPIGLRKLIHNRSNHQVKKDPSHYASHLSC